MKHKKTIFSILAGLSLGLLAVALLPKGNMFKTEAAGDYNYTLVTDISTLANDDKVVIKTADSSKGVTGADGNKDATTSATESDWVQYVVKDKSSDGVKLYDSGEEKYIASPTGNHFKYDTSGGVCSTDSNGVLKCNSRYLQLNESYVRFYNAINTDYTPFLTYKVTPSKTISSIAVKTAPTKTTYYAGETFEPDGLIITVTWSNSDTEDVTYNSSTSSSFTFTPTTLSGSGEVSVEIGYGGKTCSQTVTVNPVTITAIAVTTMPTKTSYYVGDTFDPAGMIVTGTHAGGTVNVTSGCTFSPSTAFVEADIGTKQITVTHTESGQTTTLNVSVAAAPAVAQYVLVESTDDISAGDKVLIAQRGTETKALGAYTKNSSGTTTYFADATGDAAKSSDGKKISGLPTGAIEFNVEYNSSKDAYAFKSDANKYIAAKSDSSNIVDYTTTLNDEGWWDLTISSSDTEMVSKGTHTKNYFAHNVSATRFSCYNSTSSGIDHIGIYKYTSGAESITLNKTSVAGPTGTELVLTATPSTGYEVTSYNWSTGDTAVASFVADGNTATVTFEGEGTTAITCTASDGTIVRSASCTITVHNYTYDVLTGNEYIITNEDLSNGLSTSDPTKDVTDIDITLATNAYHFERANVADNSYYITYGSKYLEKNGTYARLGLFDEPSTYWVVSRPTLGVDIFHLVDGNGNKLVYKSTNTIKFIAVASPDSGCDEDLGLVQIQTFDHLEASGTLIKKRYNVGEDFEPANMTIKAVFSGGAEKDVTAGISWAPLAVGDTHATGTITIGGVQKGIEIDGIEVTNYVVQSISVDYSAALTSYFVGQETSKDGLVVIATLKDQAGIGDDKQEVVAADKYTLSPSVIAESTDEVVISYQGQTTSYPVTVSPVRFEPAESLTDGDLVVFTDEDREYEMAPRTGESYAYWADEFTYRPVGKMVFEVEKNGSDYSFRSVDTNKYLALNGTALEPVDSLNTNAKWTVSINRTTGYNYVCSVADTSKYMSYNAGKFKTSTSPSLDIFKDITTEQVQSIQIEHPANQTTFEIGDEFSYEGLTIRANYGGGAFDIITTGFKVTPPNMNTAGSKTVTITYRGQSTSYQITVNPSSVKVLVGIEGRNYNTEFKVGDNFVFGGEVYALYSNGDEEKLNASAYEITVHGPSGTGYPFTEANAHQQITITLKSDYSKTFQYEVVVGEAAKLESIAVSGQKTEFNVGDEFEFGGTVTATFDDQTTKNVTSEATFTGYNMNSVGTQTVTVSYSYKGVTKTTTYTITVKESGGGGGSSGDSSSTDPDNPSGDNDNKGNNLMWIIPVAIGGTVLVAGLGVGIFFFVKAKRR